LTIPWRLRDREPSTAIIVALTGATDDALIVEYGVSGAYRPHPRMRTPHYQWLPHLRALGREVLRERPSRDNGEFG